MERMAANNPARAERDIAIADMRLAGYSYRKIAKAVGLTDGRVCQIIKSDESVKALIDEGSRLQAVLLPLSVERHAEILADKDAAHKDVLNAIKLTYQNTSVSPTHTKPTVINNVLVQQQSILDPKLLDGFDEWFFRRAGETVEAEVIEDSETG